MSTNIKYATTILLSAIIIISSFMVLMVSTTQIVNAETDASTTAPVCDPAKDSSCTDSAFDCTGDKCNLYAKYINPMIVFLSAAAGVAVTIGLVYGGIQYASAGSDPGAVSKARNTIKGSIVALIAFLFLLALLNWLVPGGLT